MIIIKIFIILYFFCFSSVKSDSGDLIQFDFQETLSISYIESVLNILGIDISNTMYSISVYDIKYESHRLDNTIDTLSGLVCIPQNQIEAFPILSYQHGTTSLDQDAPSITGLTFANTEVLLIALVSSPSGFITIFPDYEGLGDPEKFHPYIIADSYTRAVVNMIRAVKSLSNIIQSDDEFQFNEQLFLLGYSEGGYATLAAQRGIELNFNDEIIITASLPMAGPYDFSGSMVDYFLSSPYYSSPYYVPYVLTSHLWNYQGIDVDFHEYFETFWADTLPSLYDGTHSGAEINAMMPDDVLEILLDDVLEEFINNEEHFFRQTLAQNTLLDWTPQTDTYLFHGLGDDIIPYENSQIAYDIFQANGAPNVNIDLLSSVFGGHSTVAFPCLLSGYEIILDYQKISRKGDMNSDEIISLVDVALLSSSMMNQYEINEYQWWAGDYDYDNTHNISDILYIADMIE